MGIIISFNDGCIYGICASLRTNEFQGATVITNLFSGPLVGEGIVTWLWGGYSVDNQL